MMKRRGNTLWRVKVNFGLLYAFFGTMRCHTQAKTIDEGRSGFWAMIHLHTPKPIID